MIRRKLSPLLFVLLLFAFMARENFQQTVLAEDTSQTIPTRTPTSAPPTATQPAGGGNDPTPTSPPQSEATPTSTLLPVQFAPTPVGGFIATAVPCGSNPTIQALGASNVRNGPGIDYDVVGELVYLEVRYIVGRAESAKWWLIQFNDGQLGWVADEIVLVQGYTPIIPIVAAPPLAGSTPTPGPAWNPTPLPFCTVTPIPTAIPSATPSSEPAAALLTQTAVPTEPPPTEVRPTATAIVQPTPVPLNPTAAATNEPITPPTSDDINVGIILLVVGLLGAVVLIIFYRRRQ